MSSDQTASGEVTQPARGGDAPVPRLPKAAVVEPGNSYFERLAAPLPPRVEPKTEVPEGFKIDGETVQERDARQLAARLPEGYEPESGADLTFDPRIPYVLALGLHKPSEVFAKYGVSDEQARALIANPVFLDTLKRYKDEVTANGISFKLKAKIQAEDLLTHSYVLATNPEVPAAVRADLIKWTAKMAGLEPSDKKGDGGTGGGGFSLKIVFGGSAEPRVIQGSHTVIEGGDNGAA